MNIPASLAAAETPPSAAWVRFLRSYGPTPNNQSLFDEYVTQALAKAKVEPIALPSPDLDALKLALDKQTSGAVLVVGTAGDGKTYHCRGLWTHLGGSEAEWRRRTVVKTLQLATGATATFVKDLSELSDIDSDRVLASLEQIVDGVDTESLLVMAANHGQMLERLRNLGQRQGRVHPLRKPLQDVFLQSAAAPQRLRVLDLSRVDQRGTLEAVLTTVATHPAWQNCQSCALQGAGRVCPILENRNRLLPNFGGEQLIQRLGDLVDLARLNGWHLPVRDLLALVANLILGHVGVGIKEGLIACADVSQIQSAHMEEGASLYGNIFGNNLSPRMRDRPIFQALASFGIGRETSNGADGLLVYGREDSLLTAAYAALVETDQIYGATPAFDSLRDRYLEGEDEARLDHGAREFLARLIAQRQRLFFTLPDTGVLASAYPHWGMSAFRFAGDYLQSIRTLQGKSAVFEPIRNRLIRGLNRVMTGLLLDNTERIFVASSGGFTQSRINVLLDSEVMARRSAQGGLAIRLENRTERLLLDIAFPGGHKVGFALTPIRFEFLCRVADGALPSSFSNECLEDMLAFKAKLLRKAELLRNRLEHEEDGDYGEQGALCLNFIEIEASGHGYARPVTVQVGQ